MVGRRWPYPSGHILMILIYQSKLETETLFLLKQPSYKILCQPQTLKWVDVAFHVFKKNKLPNDDYIIKGNIVRKT